MAAPQNGVLDDFNRADEDPLSNGGNWQPTGNNQPLRLVSNQAASIDSSFGRECYWGANTYGPDMEAYCTISTKPLNGEWVFVSVRSVPATSSYYMVCFALAGTDQFAIYRQDPGNLNPGVQIATANQEYNDGDRIWLKIEGSLITGYIDSAGAGFSQVISVTDTTYSNAARVSLQIKNGTGRIDNFGGGSLPFGPAQIYRYRTP